MVDLIGGHHALAHGLSASGRQLALKPATAFGCELVAGLVVADGCPTDQAPLVASMIVAQARGLQLDLHATSDHERVDRGFALFVELIVQFRRTWR